MKNLSRILKPTRLKMAIMGLFGLLLLNSCSKEVDDVSNSKESAWHKAEYKAIINKKEYDFKVEYQETGNRIKLDESMDKEVFDFFEKNGQTICVHQVDDLIYYYANSEEMDKEVKFFVDKSKYAENENAPHSKSVKAYNGGYSAWFKDPMEYPWYGGGNQVDELLTYKSVGGNGGFPTTAITTWVGETPWVGPNFNDQITYVWGSINNYVEPLHLCFWADANWGGNRYVITISNKHQHLRGKDLRQVFRTVLPWASNWNDCISSHFTFQSSASVGDIVL